MTGWLDDTRGVGYSPPYVSPNPDPNYNSKSTNPTTKYSCE